MITDLQKASVLKRISAGILDGILLAILAVGFALALSGILGYNQQIDELTDAYDRYEAQYGVEFQISQEEYNAMSDAQKQAYDTAYEALIADASVVKTYNMVINLTLIITTFGLLLSVLILEFFVPVLFRNGQTVGKKIFSIGVIRTDGVKANNLQLFARAVLGKFTIELMIPTYIIIMIFFNSMGLLGPTILLILGLSQIIAIIATRTNSLLHDLLAGTVAVDMASQMIFETKDDLIEYTKKLHAEKAERATY